MMSAWLSAEREYFSRMEFTAKLAPSCARAALVELLPIKPPRSPAEVVQPLPCFAWLVPWRRANVRISWASTPASWDSLSAASITPRLM